MKLNLGCGFNREEGFVGVDIIKHKGVDVICDLNNFPYPFKDNSVDYVKIFHVLEHLDNPVKVLEELYRIGKDKSYIEIIVPHWKEDSSRNPWHKHHFRPIWFKVLCKGTSRSIRFKMKHKFELIKIKKIRGKRRFWKVYAFCILLKIVK